MTKKILISAVCVFVAAVITLTVLCSFLPISYESTEAINNPDQGFYRPIYVKMTDTEATYNKNIVTASTQLYHLRIDISEFSQAVNGTADKQLSENALEDLDGLLAYLKEKEKSAIVRFAYDPKYEGAKDKEPAQEMILEHIRQAGTVLNKYQTTITAIEAGLVGPWGEMHSSAIANAEHISPIIDCF